VITDASPRWDKMSGVHHQPDGAAFDIVLLLHVGCVVVGLATMVTSAATAARLRRLLQSKTSYPEAVVRYFRPGVNWAGRILYGIPIFGFALVAMSQGAYSLHDAWVTVGLAIFVVVVLLAEGSVWPAERRLQVSLTPLYGGGIEADPSVGRDARALAVTSTIALVLLVAGSGVMLAQP
jgi:hypothetical protein